MSRSAILLVVATARLAAQTPGELQFRMERVMGPSPALASAAPKMTVLSVERLESLTRYRVEYEAEPGEGVPAYLLVPHASGRHPAALCLHQTTRLGKGEPAGLGPNASLHYALELAHRGFVTIAPDYPNFGDYRTDVYGTGYASATMKGIVNHRRAVDLLVSLPEVDPARIAAIGHSLGGHNSLFAAAFDPRIRAAVTSCGFTSFARYYGGNLTGWSHRGYMPRIADVYGRDPARMPFDFTDVLSAIAPRAVFVNAPMHDSNFDVTGVRETVGAVEAKFPPGALQVSYPDAGHAFPDAVRRQAYEFIEKVLGVR